MKKRIKVIILFTAFILSGALLGLASVDAVAPDDGGIPTDTPTTGQGLLQLFEDISDWIFVFFIVAATIFVILAGFQFVTGGGDPTQVAEARRKLLYAVIGVAVAVLSLSIPAVIQNIISPG